VDKRNLGTSNILKRCHPLSVRIGSVAPICVVEIMDNLIFTVGRNDIYKPYLNTKNPKKGVGESVWKTYEEAKQYALKGYDVYGVIARWGIDTRLDPDGNGWHKLLVASPLKRLGFRN
jgi:hypothetical protein